MKSRSSSPQTSPQVVVGRRYRVESSSSPASPAKAAGAGGKLHLHLSRGTKAWIVPAASILRLHNEVETNMAVTEVLTWLLNYRSQISKPEEE